MVPKSANEKDIRAVFEMYGPLREVHVIRSLESSRGCAFVKYANRESALAAIDDLHDRHTMPGGPRPLVVKFANKRRMGAQAAPTDISSPSRSSTGHSLEEEGWPGHLGAAIGGGYAYPLAPPPSALHMLDTMPRQPHGSMHATSPPSFSEYCPSTPMRFESSILDMDGYYSGSSGSAGRGVGQRGQDYTNSRHGFEQDNKYHGVVTASKPAEGPRGANLFIYHLPQDLSDADLETAFAPFGRVLSAKVYIDRVSGESKGFGETILCNPLVCCSFAARAVQEETSL